MRLATSLLLLTSLVSVSSFAQQGDALSGKWLAKYNAPDGRPVEATVVIRGDSGTWYQPQFRTNPCTGREVPISVESVTPEGFKFSIHRSKAVSGCDDAAWEMKRIDDKSFEATTPDGRKVVLVRQ